MSEMPDIDFSDVARRPVGVAEQTHEVLASFERARQLFGDFWQSYHAAFGVPAPAYASPGSTATPRLASTARACATNQKRASTTLRTIFRGRGDPSRALIFRWAGKHEEVNGSTTARCARVPASAPSTAARAGAASWPHARTPRSVLSV